MLVACSRDGGGIAKAKGEGKYKGRAPTARAKAAEVRQLAADGMSKARIAAELGISERSVFRVLSQPASYFERHR